MGRKIFQNFLSVSPILILSVFILHHFSNFLYSKPSGFISLEGYWKFSPKDKILFSHLNFDDSSWPSLRVPGIWRPYICPSVGWYRVHFKIPSYIEKDKLGIDLGHIRTADETYFNGIRIGGEGIIGDDFVEATKKERIYRIPKDLIISDGLNLLAVRVQSTYLEGGIISGPVRIGVYKDLIIESAKRSHTEKMIEAFTLGIFLTICLFCALLYLSGVRDKEYLYFGLFVLNYATIYLVDSLIFYDTGFKSPFVQRCGISLNIIMPALFIIFLFSVYRMKLNFFIKLINVLFLVLSITYLFAAPSIKTYEIMLYFWTILVLFCIPLFLSYSVKGYVRERLPEFKPLLLGLFFLFGTIVVDGTHIIHIHTLFTKETFHIGMMSFIFFAIYALTVRYMRLSREHKFLSERVLKAQEEERKRVARELHDSLGQSLLGVKLNLQMLRQKFFGKIDGEGDFLSQTIREVGDVIDELREISLNLTPAFLEHMGLGVAIKWYSKKFAKRAGIDIDVCVEDAVRAPITVEENLYRIFQEAMQNAVKHAKADKIEIELSKRENVLKLSIKDNGVGFDYNKTLKNSKGLGLLAMRERVSIIGGTLFVSTQKGKGTHISVEVPLNW